jgi:hypothetical protein
MKSHSKYNGMTKKEDTMTATALKKEPKESKTEISPSTIMKNLHDKIQLPKNYSHTRAFNVYDNRWRINVYSFAKSEVPSLIKKLFISQSFFLQVDKEGNILNNIN